MSRVNQILTSSERYGLSAEQIIGGSNTDIANVQSHAVALTGSDICPAVLYKGKLIPAGRIGDRSISE
jgi:hypothetical protein